MKLVDLTLCHEDSPDFRASLSQLEEAANLLEKRLKTVSSLCEERRALNEKERAVTQKLIREFDLISQSDPCLPTDSKDWDTAVLTVEVMTTAMKQLLDNQERMFDQINIAIMRPLKQFLAQDLEQVKTIKKAYYKAHSEAHQVTDKFGQCKKHEIQLLNEISLQLYDARADLHKASCAYTLELNALHTKKTPDFLNRVVDFMMSQLTFFHLGHVTVKDTEPYITTIYGLIEKLREKAILQDTQHRTQAQNLMEETLHSRAQSLLHLYTSDLHNSLGTARGTISEHLSSTYPDARPSEEQLELPVRTSSAPAARTKAGYMWYAEPKTFGIHWIRLYFCIKNSMLVSESTTKVRVPISLNLNLCNVKPAEVNDTERNFSFKVTSPVRVLLLQAEGSLEMQDWLDTLGNAIAHAIHGAPSSPPAEDRGSSSFSSSVGSGKSGSGGGASRGGAKEEPMPIKPPRRKSNASKDLSGIPGNEVCADCGSNRPKWASMNLGVLICIECSGIHRSLGVYVSQVRSLTLDLIKPVDILRLKAIGNKKANAVYEASLPQEFDRSRLKKGDNRQEFITEKYLGMKYVLPAEKERILVKRQDARSESIRKSGYPINESNSSTATVAEVKVQPIDEGGGALSSGGGVGQLDTAAEGCVVREPETPPTSNLEVGVVDSNGTAEPVTESTAS